MSTTSPAPRAGAFGFEIHRGPRPIVRCAAAFSTYDEAVAGLRTAYLAEHDHRFLGLYVTHTTGAGCAMERLAARVVVRGWTPAELAALDQLRAPSPEPTES